MDGSILHACYVCIFECHVSTGHLSRLEGSHLQWRCREESGLRLDAATAAAQARTVQLIVNHLINKEGVLVIVEQPPQNEGEGDEAYRNRRVRERVLAISPNYEEA